MRNYLLTKEIFDMFLRVGTQQNEIDPLVICKFFTPWSSFKWYAIAYTPNNGGVFFGYVSSGYNGELGYFQLQELQSIQGPYGQRIERDIYFIPMRLSNIRK